MTAIYFGDYWDVPALEGATHHVTPVGVRCLYCEHPLEGGDRGYMRVVVTDHAAELRPAHRGCDFASTLGHVYGVCGCYGFDDMWSRNVELERRGIFKLADQLGAARYN